MDINQQRQKLLDAMQDPRLQSLDQVRELRARVQEWLEQHPNDRQVLEIGESLNMLESALLHNL